MWIILSKTVPVLWLVCHRSCLGSEKGHFRQINRAIPNLGCWWCVEVVLFLGQGFWGVGGLLGRLGVAVERAEERPWKTNLLAAQLCLRMSENLWKPFPAPQCITQWAQMFWFWRNRSFPLDIFPQTFFMWSLLRLSFPPTHPPPPPHYLPISFSPLAQPNYFCL